MELTRRDFLGCLLAAGACALCPAQTGAGPAAAARLFPEAPPGAYPGPVVPLDGHAIRTQAIWLG